jgi:hypothetical protein
MKSTDKPIILNQSPSVKNPPAFPLQHQPALLTNEGMTLRDYFAAKAMAALIATPEGMEAAGMDRNPNEMRSHIAAMCYAIADAMLQERGKQQ